MLVEGTFVSQRPPGGLLDQRNAHHLTMVQQSDPTTQNARRSHHLHRDTLSPMSMDGDDSYLRWCSTSQGHSISLPCAMLSDDPVKMEREMDYDEADSSGSPGTNSNSHSHSPGVLHSPARSPHTGGSTGGDSVEHLGGGGIAGKRRKEKGAGLTGKSIEEELCLICGDRASGYHYNALSCEGCKGFFRRSITRSSSYQCKFGGHCEMDMWMRRKCQSCRLRRCREVGMKEECLLSDDQCKARDVRRKARQRVQKTQPPTIDLDPPIEIQHSPDSNTADPRTPDVDTGSVNPLDCISLDHRNLIETLVYNQDKFELPSEEDIQKVSNVRISDVGRPKDMSETIYKMIAEMTILTTQLVVEFAKHLPGFSEINKEDQIILLKGSASEVMVLRTARRYDLESGTVILGNGMPMSKESMQMVGLHEYMESLFAFCRTMAVLAVDNAEYVLITALSILTERPGLNNPVEIERIHDMYLHCLIDYNRYRRTRGSNFLAKLLMKFTDLQTVSQIHTTSLYDLKLEKVSLPPLLSEYFDVMD